MMFFGGLTAGRLRIRSGSIRGELLLDGVHGRLVPPGDVPALTAALAQLLNDRVRAGACAASVRQLAHALPQWFGLAPDDRVITAPPDGLADGDQVRIAGGSAKGGKPATASEKQDVKG